MRSVEKEGKKAIVQLVENVVDRYCPRFGDVIVLASCQWQVASGKLSVASCHYRLSIERVATENASFYTVESHSNGF